MQFSNVLLSIIIFSIMFVPLTGLSSRLTCYSFVLSINNRESHKKTWSSWQKYHKKICLIWLQLWTCFFRRYIFLSIFMSIWLLWSAFSSSIFFHYRDYCRLDKLRLVLSHSQPSHRKKLQSMPTILLLAYIQLSSCCFCNMCCYIVPIRFFNE